MLVVFVYVLQKATRASLCRAYISDFIIFLTKEFSASAGEKRCGILGFRSNKNRGNAEGGGAQRVNII